MVHPWWPAVSMCSETALILKGCYLLHFSFDDQHSNPAAFQLQLEVRMFLILSCLQGDCLCPRFSRVLTSEGTFWALVLSCIHTVSIYLDALIWCAQRETLGSKHWGAGITNTDVTLQEPGCIQQDRCKLLLNSKCCPSSYVRLETLWSVLCSPACPMGCVIVRSTHSSSGIPLCLITQHEIVSFGKEP